MTEEQPTGFKFIDMLEDEIAQLTDAQLSAIADLTLLVRDLLDWDRKAKSVFTSSTWPILAAAKNRGVLGAAP